MFNLFKKKYSAQNRAYLIATTTGEYSSGLDKTVNEFLERYPDHKGNKNRIIDELQWIISTGGLVAIRLLSDHKKVKETYSELIEFYRALHKSNDNSTLFTDTYLIAMDKKFESYMIRFNRGIVLREETSSTYDEALFDVANESMKYFTGETRHFKVVDFEDIDKLQQRPDPNELEHLVKTILGQFVAIFVSDFKKVQIV
ncbi:MAG: hypothetical protein HOG49_33005 [Candidatus Scalindua sp.]|jgi:hypothetical protein|nr:hypothetical protein [Candidatus Scalindua sp.]